MYQQNLCFHGDVRKNINTSELKKKSTLSRAMLSMGQRVNLKGQLT